MTRSVWLKADDEVGDWEARKRRITAGLEAGVDWVLVDRRDVGRVRDLGRVNVAAFAGDDVHVMDAETEETPEPDAVIVGKDGEGDGTVDLPSDLSGSADLTTLRRTDGSGGAYVRILGAEYESFAEAAAEESDHTLVVGEDWQIIPLENLIARIGEETDLVAGVRTAEEAKTAFETLELGADAVLLDTDDPDEIRATVGVRDATEREHLDLEYATVTAVEETGSGGSRLRRHGVDARGRRGDVDRLDESRALFRPRRDRRLAVRRLQAVPRQRGCRPRVRPDAGRRDKVPRGAEIRRRGAGRRHRREHPGGDRRPREDRKRPMFRVEAELENGDRIETLLQNAETIRVATAAGRKSVTDLEAGDELLVRYEDVARHFGEAVEESIIEK